jgi:aspartate/methionine/tyrosine aminotransferase
MPRKLVAGRMTDIPFAGIRRVFEKAARLEAEGKKVIHFEIGRPDFDTPSHIKEAAKRALERGMVHYTPNMGVMELRQAVAESLQEYKRVSYDPSSEIMITAGGQEAMYLSLMAILEPGDEVLVPDPGFSQFTSCVRLAGGIPVHYPLLLRDNSSPDVKSAEILLSSRTRAIIVNSPHNPTGGVMTRRQMEQVSRFADKYELLLFSDEAYDRILFDDSDFCSPASLGGMREKTVIWGSLSKTYAMTGWRIGYLAGPAEVLTGAVKVQQNVMLSLCSFAQMGAVAALRGSQECVKKMVAEFARRRRVILEGISQAPGLVCETMPKGAFYVFVKHDVPGLTSSSLADYFLEKGGVAVVPGHTFGARGEGHVRISYATSLEDCQEGVERIIRCMKELTRGPSSD